MLWLCSLLYLAGDSLHDSHHPIIHEMDHLDTELFNRSCTIRGGLSSPLLPPADSAEWEKLEQTIERAASPKK